MGPIIPDITVVYSGRFPPGYENSVKYWGFFPKEEIESNWGKLMMLDVDMGRGCSLDCPTCFRRSSTVDDDGGSDLSYDERIAIIREAAASYPIQSVKVCGVGEPLEDRNFLRFVRDMDAMGIGVNAFTKGHVLGSDRWTRKIYGEEYGMRTAEELAEEFAKYKLSLNLCCQSFRPDAQDAMVGRRGYTKLRNRAMGILAGAGFNKGNPTRLCLANAPVTRQNVDDAFGIYVFARERNMYPVIVVSMTSGKQLTPEFIGNVDLTREQKVRLWTEAYSWNIDHGIQTLDQLREEGISCIAGGHVCNQNAAGIYITAKGNVVRCPGFTEIIGNVKKEKIKDIWERASGAYAGRFNCHCPPKDGITIPDGFYDEVLEKLGAIYG